MIQLDTIAALRAWRSQHPQVALVPTMGNLHAGHLSLINLAQQHADHVLVSIFVNPLQFGAGEDFNRYPRTLEHDRTLLTSAGAAALFVPSTTDLYPHEQTCYIELPAVSNTLCGASRPGHFRGVATVVMKLFNLVQPDVAVFGHKDYQQLSLIRRMTDEFCLPIRILAGDTVRAADGLALSSRNQYLNAQQRAQAPQLYQQLQYIVTQLKLGQRDFDKLEQTAVQSLEQQGWQVDYVSIRDDTLEPPAPTTSHWVVLAAARLGTTRLIDNECIKLK